MSRSLEREQPVAPRNKKLNVVLQAVFFTPLAVLMVVAFIYAITKILAGDYGHIVLLVVSGLLGTLFAFQAVHYLRDIGAEPVQSEGEVAKKWHKANLFFFFMPSYYIAVKGKIYTLSRDEYRGLLEDDLVRIRHYPNTLTVELVERYDESEKKFVPAGPDAYLV